MNKIYKNRIIWLEIIGLVFSVVFSFVFHFMYEWINTLGWLFPVNESVWEHIKILFMPYLIYSIIEFFILKPEDKLNYFSIKSIALIVIPIVMITLFYTYSGIIGNHYVFVDGMIGVISLLIGFMISLKLLLIEYKCKNKPVPIILAGIIFILLIVFTYYPPHINLFYDTLDGKYGI